MNEFEQEVTALQDEFPDIPMGFAWGAAYGFLQFYRSTGGDDEDIEEILNVVVLESRVYALGVRYMGLRRRHGLEVFPEAALQPS